MKFFSLRSAAVCSLLLLLQQTFTPLVKCDTIQADTTGRCQGLEYQHFVEETSHGLLFTFLNLNERIPLNYVDLHFKIVDEMRMKRLKRMKTIQLGRMGYDLGSNKELLNMVLKEPSMGELINKRMRMKPVGGRYTTTGKSAAQVFQFIEPSQRLNPRHRVVYSFTVNSGDQCEVGPFNENETTDNVKIRVEHKQPSDELDREGQIKTVESESEISTPDSSLSEESDSENSSSESNVDTLNSMMEDEEEDNRETAMQTMKDVHLFDPLSEETLDFSTAAVTPDTRSIYLAEMSVDDEAEAESDNEASVFHIAQESALNFSTDCPLIHFEQRVIPANETYTDSTGTVIGFINQNANTTQLAFILLVFNASSKTDMGTLDFRGRQVFLTSAHPLFRRMIETADETAKDEAVVPQSNFTFILPQFPDNTTINYYFIYGTGKDKCKTETFTIQTTSHTSMSRLMMGRGRVLGTGDSLMWRMREEGRHWEQTDEATPDSRPVMRHELEDSEE